MSKGHANRNSAFPENQRSNLLQELSERIREAMNTDDLSYPEAFKIVALECLGYDDRESADNSDMSDGPGDRGIDFYAFKPGKVEIFQCKGRDADILDIWKEKHDRKNLGDINSILNYLNTAHKAKREQNHSIRGFQQTLLSELRKFRRQGGDGGEIQDVYKIDISLILSGSGLTDQAKEMFREIQQSSKNLTVNGVECSVEFKILGIDRLLEAQWALGNFGWRDRGGDKRDRITVAIRGDVIDDEGFKVFFAKAYDLINGYEDFGQRIFEDNVRCAISKSAVNKKIEDQIQTEKGIKKFHLLNNGLTILAESVSAKPSDRGKPGCATFVKPGIVNGLQTITTLSETYKDMGSELKKIFEKECYVLVRAFEKGAVEDVGELIIATNTQNVMDPRNLKSNEEEQKALEKDFAKEGWFYERKEFAWEAFRESEDWPTLPGKKPQHFAIQTSHDARRRKYRVAENSHVAEAWLAFIGFSSEAMHDKKRIFVDTHDYYKTVFERRPEQHSLQEGGDYRLKYDPRRIKEDFEPQSPPHQALLTAYLLSKAAKQLTPSNQDHRKHMEKKLGITSTRITPEEKATLLMKESEYLAGVVKNTAMYIYVEMVGYLLFKKYGKGLYRIFPNLLEKTDLQRLKTSMDATLISEAVKDGKFEENHLVGKSWSMFCNIIEQLAGGSWKELYHQTTSRTRMVYNVKTRIQVFEIIDSWDQNLQKGADYLAAFAWAKHAVQHKSLVDGIVSCPE